MSASKNKRQRVIPKGNRPVGIVGLGFYVPEKVLTNFDLEKMVDTTDEWITTKIGIKERPIASEKEAASDLSIKAAINAMADANIKPSEIDLIIVSASNHDMIMPSTACIVQRHIGAKNAATFDIRAACAGFIYAMAIGGKFIADYTYNTALIIGVEIHSKMVNWNDRTTCVFFSDGAGAAILREVRKDRGILSIELGSDGASGDALVVPAGGSRLPASLETVREGLHYIKMDGKGIWNFAVTVFPQSINKALKKCSLSPKDVDFVIAHQANVNIIKEGMKRLGLPMSKTYINIDKFGNTSAASIPIALYEAVEKGLIKDNDIVALVGFGAGLSWGAAVLRWSGKK